MTAADGESVAAAGGPGVLLSGDQLSVVDAVATALTQIGFTTTPLRFVAVDEPQQTSTTSRVGLLLCDPEEPPKLLVAASIVTRIRLPWVVVASTPPGPGWDALRAAGARKVVPHDVSLADLTTTLRGMLGGVTGSPSRSRR